MSPIKINKQVIKSEEPKKKDKRVYDELKEEYERIKLKNSQLIKLSETNKINYETNKINLNSNQKI